MTPLRAYIKASFNEVSPGYIAKQILKSSSCLDSPKKNKQAADLIQKAMDKVKKLELVKNQIKPPKKIVK